MAETLGTLSDKLTIVKLKQFHTQDGEQLQSLARQEAQLQAEIDEFITAATSGKIPVEKLTFSANKVYKKDGNETQEIKGSLGEIFSQLADTNCQLWHVQEKVYEFEAVPTVEKDGVVKELAKKLHDLLADLKNQGKRVHIYGASTKGNTILQFCGIDKNLIECAAERNPDKYGARTLGTDIPIVSEEDSRALSPDYYLVLPWHFKAEFIEREREMLNKGVGFIFPLPSIEIVKK